MITTPYKPLQLNIGVEYRELYPCVALKELVAFIWELRNNSGEPLHYTIIPDGCIDFVSGINQKTELLVSVSMYRLNGVQVLPGQSMWGVRFMPSAFTSLLRISMNDLNGVPSISLAELAPELKPQLLIDRLHTTSTLEQKRTILERFLLTHLSKKELKTDAHLLNALNYIYQNKGNIRVEESKNFTVSPRQLRRIFNHYLGFSPKEFAHIVQMQNTLLDLRQKNFDFFNYGFYDQPHFIREFKKFTGMNPGKLRENRKG